MRDASQSTGEPCLFNTVLIEAESPALLQDTFSAVSIGE